MPPIITHFLLSPSIISHLQLLLIFSSMREIPHQSSFVGVDSLEKTRFRFHCIDIFHFKMCLLLSPSTYGHHPSYNATTCFEMVSFKFSYIAILLPLLSPFIAYPPTVSRPAALDFVSSICHPPLHSTHYILAYLVKLSVYFTFYPKFTSIFC